MGRPGGPALRFLANEVAEMEACLQESNLSVPGREVLESLAEKFSASAERAGKIIVQPKQVLTWFQNRRRPHRSKVKAPANSNASYMPRDDSVPARTVAHSAPVPSGSSGSDNNNQMKFEAKSARDGAWYDVELFTAHRLFDTIEPEVCVRFAGFRADEDEWVNVAKHVRHQSLPCAASECVVVLNGDLILCFQESKEQDLYFDAHVVDVQRRRHDIRGCRCRFLVRFVHDQSEEIVPLRKICRRPETDYRFQLLHASKKQPPLEANADEAVMTTLAAMETAISMTKAENMSHIQMGDAQVGDAGFGPGVYMEPESNKSN